MEGIWRILPIKLKTNICVISVSLFFAFNLKSWWRLSFLFASGSLPFFCGGNVNSRGNVNFFMVAWHYAHCFVAPFDYFGPSSSLFSLDKSILCAPTNECNSGLVFRGLIWGIPGVSVGLDFIDLWMNMQLFRLRKDLYSRLQCKGWKRCFFLVYS